MKQKLFKDMKICPIILCRGGSKSVPRKNIKLLNGKPLLSYVLSEALKVFPKVYLSTEDEEIARIGNEYGATIIPRPPKLAQDDSKSIDAVKHALNHLKKRYGLNFDYVMLSNACCPLTKVEDIQACVDIAVREKPDSVVSLVEDFSSHPSKLCYLIENKVYPINASYIFETGERQKQAPIFKRNTAIYCATIATIRKGSFFGKSTIGYVMPKTRSYDLNDMDDWNLMELILKNV